MTRLRLLVDGRVHEVVLAEGTDGRTVTVDGASFTLDAVHTRPTAAFIEVMLDGHTHTVQRLDLERARIDDTVSTYRVDTVHAGETSGRVGPSGAQVRPPMPGKVVALHVQTGDVVVEGQVLLVLEAMKMQNEVTSPAAGVVTDLPVPAGTTVDTGDVLVVLGPPPVEAVPVRPVVA